LDNPDIGAPLVGIGIMGIGIITDGDIIILLPLLFFCHLLRLHQSLGFSLALTTTTGDDKGELRLALKLGLFRSITGPKGRLSVQAGKG
jgi:hypothetical protein